MTDNAQFRAGAAEPMMGGLGGEDGVVGGRHTNNVGAVRWDIFAEQRSVDNDLPFFALGNPNFLDNRCNNKISGCIQQIMPSFVFEIIKGSCRVINFTHFCIWGTFIVSFGYAMSQIYKLMDFHCGNDVNFPIKSLNDLPITIPCVMQLLSIWVFGYVAKTSFRLITYYDSDTQTLWKQLNDEIQMQRERGQVVIRDMTRDYMKIRGRMVEVSEDLAALAVMNITDCVRYHIKNDEDKIIVQHGVAHFISVPLQVADHIYNKDFLNPEQRSVKNMLRETEWNPGDEPLTNRFWNEMSLAQRTSKLIETCFAPLKTKVADNTEKLTSRIKELEADSEEYRIYMRYQNLKPQDFEKRRGAWVVVAQGNAKVEFKGERIYLYKELAACRDKMDKWTPEEKTKDAAEVDAESMGKEDDIPVPPGCSLDMIEWLVREGDREITMHMEPKPNKDRPDGVHQITELDAFLSETPPSSNKPSHKPPPGGWVLVTFRRPGESSKSTFRPFPVWADGCGCRKKGPERGKSYPYTWHVGCLKWTISSKVHHELTWGFFVSLFFLLYYAYQVIDLNFLEDCPEDYHGWRNCQTLKLRKALGFSAFIAFILMIAWSIKKIHMIDVNAQLTLTLDKTREMNSKLEGFQKTIHGEDYKKMTNLLDWSDYWMRGPLMVMAFHATNIRDYSRENKLEKERACTQRLVADIKSMGRPIAHPNQLKDFQEAVANYRKNLKDAPSGDLPALNMECEFTRKGFEELPAVTQITNDETRSWPSCLKALSDVGDIKGVERREKLEKAIKDAEDARLPKNYITVKDMPGPKGKEKNAYDHLNELKEVTAGQASRVQEMEDAV